MQFLRDAMEKISNKYVARFAEKSFFIYIMVLIFLTKYCVNGDTLKK